MALDKYSYVSLFGRNSLDDLRVAIVENTVDARAPGEKPDLKSFKSILSTLEGLTGRASKIASYVPAFKDYVGSANKALFLILRDQLICFDDLERTASGLEMMSILGLASTLKEEKSCKVVLLLNQEQLSEENGESFKTQLEKVVDVLIKFEPTPAESAEIAIDKGTKFHGWLAENTKNLGVANIRVIKKTEFFCRRIAEILANYDERLLERAIYVIALVAFAKFQPDRAPRLEFIKGYNAFADFVGRHNRAEEDAFSKDRAILTAYGFRSLDEFDLPIVEGIERGFFDPDAVRQQADRRQEQLRVGDQGAAFEAAWRLLHDSFDDNQQEVLDSIADGVRQNYQAVAPLSLSQSVAFLKEFGREKDALELIRYYVSNRQEPPEFWNLEAHPFQSDINDADVRSAFARKFAELVTPPDTEQILRHLGGHQGWTAEMLSQLSRVRQEEYVAIFKKLKGPDLRTVLSGAFAFRDISNADTAMQTITRTVEGALRQIGGESPFNAKRVANWRVRPEATRKPTPTKE